MKDKKRMLIPDNSWDIGAVESWLEDQAAEGWHLTECWGRRARFQREEPKRVRYRLMPFPDEFMQSKVEREALYADLGWRFVANRWDYQVYVCEDPAAAELETDPGPAAEKATAAHAFGVDFPADRSDLDCAVDPYCRVPSAIPHA